MINEENLQVPVGDMELEDGFLVRKSERAQGKSIRYCAICWNQRRETSELAPITGTCGRHSYNMVSGEAAERHRAALRLALCQTPRP
jgi:hypothetical protein